MKRLLPPGYRLPLPILAVLLMAAPQAPASEKLPEDCPEPRVQILEEGHSTAILLPLPGQPVSYALPRQSDGTRRIMLLMAPDQTAMEPDVVSERVRRALATGEYETLLAGQDKIEMGGGRLEIRVEKRGAGDTPYTDAILAGLAETGINLKSATAGASPCDTMAASAGAALYHLQPGPEPSWTKVQDLPLGGATALAALDLDGDGQDELLLERQGELYRIRAGDDGLYSKPPVLLFADPDLRLRADEPREVRFPPEPVAVRSPLDDDHQVGSLGDRQGPAHASLAGRLNPLHLRVISMGRLKLYGPGVSGEDWQLQSQITLPTRSLPEDSMLLLASPEIRTVGRSSQGHPILAAGPVPYGDQRLLTTIIEINSLESPRVQEIWSRLTWGEAVHESGYLMLNGEPYLWVETDNESEVEMFGDSQALRIFPLTQDPTRAGVQPVLSFEKMDDMHETRMKYGLDVNGDGLDDLVFIGRDQVGLVIGSYLQTKAGNFKRSLIRQRLGEDEKPLSFGRDLDGDDRPDLMTSTRREIRIHAGVEPTVKGKHLTLVSAQPTWRASRQRSTDESRTLVNCRDLAVSMDLDGDHRSERLCSGVDGYGRPFFKILKFTSAPVAQGLSADRSPAATGR